MAKLYSQNQPASSMTSRSLKHAVYPQRNAPSYAPCESRKCPPRRGLYEACPVSCRTSPSICANAADEQLGRTHQDASLYGRIVLAGIAADVFHQHLGAVYRKAEHLRIEPAQVLPVYVAVHRAERTESRQLPRHFQRTDVTACHISSHGSKYCKYFSSQYRAYPTVNQLLSSFLCLYLQR